MTVAFINLHSVQADLAADLLRHARHASGVT